MAHTAHTHEQGDLFIAEAISLSLKRAERLLRGLPVIHNRLARPSARQLGPSASSATQRVLNELVEPALLHVAQRAF